MSDANGSDLRRALADALLRGGVAPRYVRRALGELSVHAQQLRQLARAQGLSEAQAHQQARAQLGNPATIAAHYLQQPALRSWGARWPLLVFLAGPLLMYAAIFAGLILAGVAMVALSGPAWGAGSNPLWPGILGGAIEALRWLAVYILPALIGCLFLRYAMQRRLSWVLPAVGVMMVLLLAAAASLQIMLVEMPRPGAHGHIMVGMSAETSWRWFLLYVLKLLAMAAAVFAASVWWRRQTPDAVAE
ncbi:MAG: hypothetical protein QM718_05615 [Steroidobacteraceae bacterium]